MPRSSFSQYQPAQQPREPLPISLLSALTFSHPSTRTRTEHQTKDLLWAQWILIQSWLSAQMCFLASTTTPAGDTVRRTIFIWNGETVEQDECVEGSIAPFCSTSLMPPENTQWQWEELPAASCPKMSHTQMRQTNSHLLLFYNRECFTYEGNV